MFVSVCQWHVNDDHIWLMNEMKRDHACEYGKSLMKEASVTGNGR